VVGRRSLKFLVAGLLWTTTLPGMHGQAERASEVADHASSGSQSVAAAQTESTRLANLLHQHPELIPVVKSYLAQRMSREGAQIGQQSITDGMLFSRIQNDPAFAKDASQWLRSLAQTTAEVLKQPLPPASAGPTTEAANAKNAPSNASSAPTTQAQSTIAEGTAPAVPETKAETNYPPPATGTPVPTVSNSPPAPAQEETATLKVSSLPKYLLEDQKAFWTLPGRFKVPSLFFYVPATIGTAFLVGSDTAIEGHLPTSPNTVKLAANGSTAGALGLVGVGGGLFLLGQADKNEHQRETGFLVGEAAIDSYAISTAFQYITQRERPFSGNNKGKFFYGGNSFPSNTAAVAWSAASVLAHEYPGLLTKLLAYGVASGVSVGRVIGEKHWTSDAVVGSALGWYLGRQIYRARTSGAEISASNWGTFEKSPEDKVPDPAYMGTTYAPLDSWVYPAFERLAALGYLPTEIIAIRPWPRMECARLILEAQDQAGGSIEDPGVLAIISDLRQEFAIELANLEGASNLGVEIESAYARVTAIGGRPLRDSFNFAQTLYDDYGRPYGQGFNTVDGGAVRAEAGPFAFYFRGEFQHGSSLPNYTTSQAQQIVLTNNVPLLPLSSVPTFNETSQFRPIEAYVALNVANWEVSFGYQSYWWGTDNGTSLMFSNNAVSEPMLKFGRVSPFQLPGKLAWLGKIRNTAFVGMLPGYHWLRGPYPAFPVYGNQYQTINPPPYTWGDRISVKVTPNLELGGAVSVIWAGQGRPATLATWLHTFNSNGNFQQKDPGKRFTGFTLSYRVPKLRDWLTFYVDGMANDQPNPINSERQSAWSPGIYFPKLPHLPKLDLRVEAAYTNLIGYRGVGEYYKNERYAQGYTIYNQIIGSWVGRQGDGIQAWSTYWFSPRNKLQLAYRRQWVDKVLLEGGGLNDFSGSVDWLFKHNIQVSSMIQYERWNFPFLSSSPVSNVTTQIQIMFTPSNGRILGARPQ
jgi:membrane-associated phospholipid phosphatase